MHIIIDKDEDGYIIKIDGMNMEMRNILTYSSALENAKSIIGLFAQEGEEFSIDNRTERW